MMVTAHSAQHATPSVHPEAAAAGGDEPRQAALREANPNAQNPEPDQSVSPVSVETQLEEAELREREREARAQEENRENPERKELDSYRQVAQQERRREPVERTA